ncbi:hypothetical protein POSPLADRAFT_1148165 [Postia placenta MAD-698-R-SB12]|uniref:Ubiquinone biosynthesis monooxygenase COQ6, mitochondrial n=1 Tax=Postia placenta MAD-698-R-SB12 TaxID=670580 RepID=A0A1X6MVG9_9APHY|nr:hypothetical protein POSPLADRAFT_1148165 [Postia placenta MAD-698-R-SB12]OSX60240.1 hypothetical protein POSPLADRAFT_1148165 [Postia placenta MAD-698-R-SB12]
MSLLTRSRLAASVCKRSGSTGLRALSTVVHEDSDVVIVGGGPAGLALASALGSSPVVQDSLKITLVEASDLSKVRDWSVASDSFSNRVSSITNTSRQFLAAIGAWPYVDERRTMPIEEMQVWDGISDARITFSATEAAPAGTTAPEMARLTENLNLQRALLRYLDTTPSIKLLDKVKVNSIEKEQEEGGGWPLVHLSDGRVLRARLLVGADGFNSPVRSYAGIQSYGWAYDTQAIVATLNHRPRTHFEPPNTVAYQRFLPTGPIAFLPLSETVSSIVWSTKPPIAKALTASDPAVLATMINAAFRLPEVSIRYLHSQILEAHAAGTPLTPQQILEETSWRERSHSINQYSAYSLSALGKTAPGGIPPEDSDALPPFITSIQPDTIASFPLRFNHADTYIGGGDGARTILVGDAAHTVHPLAGQGLNMGLADVESLFRCIQNAVANGTDVGSHTALMPYARERYFENHKIMSAVDKLHKLYSTTASPVVWARSVGVEVLNELDTIKAAIMMSAGSSRRSSTQEVGWSVAASGIETLARNINTAKALGGGVLGLAGAGAQSLLKQFANMGRS